MPSARKVKSHSECLKYVCVFCHGKSAKTRDRFPRRLSQNVKNFISNKKFKDFQKFESEFPSGLCNTCNPIVNGLILALKSQTPTKICQTLPEQNFEETLKKLRETSCSNSSESCSCFICEKVTKNCIKGSKGVQKRYLKTCDKCFAKISPGKHKNCGRKERVKNLMEAVSPKTRLQLCLETVIDEKSKKSSSSPIQASRLSGGPAMPIVIGKAATNSEES